MVRVCYLTISASLLFSFSLQALNLILLTSSELSDLRDLLKKSLVHAAGKDLFVSLYASWCHSPMAIISLCLLAQVEFEWVNTWFLYQTISISKCEIPNSFLFQYYYLLLYGSHTSMLVWWFSHWWRKILMWNF